MAVITRIDGTRVVSQVGRNDGTVVQRAPQRLHRPLASIDDEAEWASTFERLRSWREESIERDVMAVVVRTLSPSGAPMFEVALAASDGTPTALIVGRHQNADVALPSTGAGSLRHAAVILWPANNGRPPRVVVIDLRTPTGIVTRQGAAVRRISSDAAVHFGAGDADVFVLVAARDQPFSIRFADQLDAHLSGALVDDQASSSAPPRDWERSVVFSANTARALVTQGLVVRASRTDVARGVVLGRYERCHRSAQIADRDVVSRVHALLFAADDALFIVDTASTGGTVLVDDATGARIALGEGHRVATLTPTARVLLAGVEVLIDASAVGRPSPAP